MQLVLPNRSIFTVYLPQTTGGHLGRDKTIEKIASRFFWRNMNDDIRMHVQQCDKCQRTNAKFPKSNKKLHPVAVHPEVWHQVSSVLHVACLCA